MRMLRWTREHKRKDKIKNKNIRGKAGVTSIDEKMNEPNVKMICAYANASCKCTC